MARFGTTSAVRRSDVVRVFANVCVDIFALYEAFVLAYILRASAAKPLAHYVSPYGFSLIVIMVAPLWVLIFTVCGLYSQRLDASRFSEGTRVVVGVAGGAMVLILWDYVHPATPIFPSRSIPIWAVLFGVVLVLTCRALVRRAVRACFARGLGLHNVILVGGGSLADAIGATLTKPGQGYRVVGSVDARLDAVDRPGPLPVFASLDAALTSMAASHCRVDEVMQADLELGRAATAQMMTLASQRGMNYRFVPDQFGVYAAASTASTVGGIPVLELRLTALEGWGAVGKRAFDLVGSVLLIAVLSPLLAATMFVLKMTEPHAPMFFGQDRLGRNGQPIKVLKFRSMSDRYSTGPGREFVTAADAFRAMGRSDLIAEFDRDQKVRDDPRISTLGRFLRSSSLDELPQLFNALRGDLSLVGPRPITPCELVRYGQQGASFLALKPGMTGLWQVSGRSHITYTERVKLDVFYVENWSIALDVRILFRTVRTVTARRGAF